MRGNRSKESKANHIVITWSKENGFSLGQKVVDEKRQTVRNAFQFVRHFC